MSKPTVLVFCATGNTGTEISLELLRNYKDDVNIRLAVHDESKVKEWSKEGCDIVKCDWNDEETTRKSLQGVQRVWLVAPNPPPSEESKPFDRINLTKKVLPFLKENNIEFIALGSAFGPESSIFTKEFRELEKAVADTGIPHCILRMCVFQENTRFHIDQLKKGVLGLPLGQGRFPPLSVRDVGIAVSKILVHPEEYKGKECILTGPEILTGDQMAKILTDVLGKEIRYEDISLDEFKKVMREFMPPYQIDGLLELYDYFKEKSPEPTSHFKDITGQKGTTFEQRMKHLYQTGELKV